MKKQKQEHRKKWRQAVTGGLARLTRKKVEQAPACFDPKAIGRSETGSLTLPAELCLPKEIETPQSDGRIVWIIVALSLVFIAFITYLVATSPESEKTPQKGAPAQTQN